jgi:hypothetical protein
MFAGFLGNQDRPHRPYVICVVFFYRFQVVGSESEIFTGDTGEIWEEAKEEEMEKVRGRTTRKVRSDSPMTDEEEVEKSFWFSRTVVTDGWVVNRKMKKIILLEFNAP